MLSFPRFRPAFAFRALRPVLVAGAAAVPAFGQETAASSAPAPVNSVSIVFENDLFFDTDRYYTNGVSIAFATSTPILPRTVWHGMDELLEFGRKEARCGYGFELAQQMATPASITIAAPQPEDRPWAGLLTVAPSYHLEGGDRLSSFKFAVGVTGPWSQADEAQDFVHRVRGLDRPKGWANQIPNEVVFGWAYEERLRFRLWDDASGWDAEWIPSAGCKLGTIEVSGRVGSEFRAGYRIPRDYGSSLIGSAGNIPGVWDERPASWLRSLGGHVFATVYGTGVAHNVMIDGTVFHDSPGIGREPWVGTVTAGFALTASRFRLAYQTVVTTEEFEGQDGSQRYGSLSVTMYW